MAMLFNPNPSNIYESLEVINGLHKEQSITVEKLNSPIDKIVANLSKDENKGFILKFEAPNYYHLDLGDIDSVTIVTEKHTFYLENIFINSIAPPNITGSISSIQTKDFNKQTNYYYRLFIPLRKKISFYSFIECYSSERLQIKYDNLELNLYKFNDKEKGLDYLILDSSTSLPFEQFSQCCFGGLVSLGYITGILPQDEGYFFAFENSNMTDSKHIYYTEFRNSMYSMYSPIYTNAHGYIRDIKTARDIQPTLRTLTLEEFSKLCQRTKDSVEFSAILLLIIEATTSSLLIMPSGLSVALEGMADLMLKKNEEKVAPIKDKTLATKIRDELKNIINNYSQNIEKEGIQILKNKIENINQLTNRSKLSKPFELLNFYLTAEDIRAIEHRNDFLHGRITLTSGNETDTNKEIYYIALRLYTLLAVLILKSVGYDNKIVNYPKIHESVYKKKLDEEYFRKV
ncbi:MAG: hypothetical protein Q8L90_12565 [Bacteroidota bacterium]|nr:hypothetical protein [Bacteroidota bacterium]